MKKLIVTIDSEKNAAQVKASLNSIKHITDIEEWDDTDKGDDDFELSPEMLAELKRRRQEMLDDPNLGMSWDDLKKEMREKYGF